LSLPIPPETNKIYAVVLAATPKGKPIAVKGRNAIDTPGVPYYPSLQILRYVFWIYCYQTVEQARFSSQPLLDAFHLRDRIELYLLSTN